MPTNATQMHNLGTTGLDAIDTLLTQAAGNINSDIHAKTVHTSPWMDLIRQTTFEEANGHTQSTLIYERALPTTQPNGSVLGVNWVDIATNIQDTQNLGPTLDQPFVGAADAFIGAQTGKAYIQFARSVKQFKLRRAVVESPRLNLEDLRFAAYRSDQLRAVMDALTESTRYTREERNRDEYDRLCRNYVVCKTTGTTTVSTGKEGTNSWDINLAGDPTGLLSNKILDSIYFRLIRGGAGTNAYGRENARPVFGLVLSSEASYGLMTEAGYIDNYRYNNAKVGELIAPLGIERSHKGFYHLVDDLAPRFTTGSGGKLARVQPYVATNGIVTENAAYETADFEAAYVLHQDVMEAQIPNPFTGSNGLSFDSTTFTGLFKWYNIQHEVINPDRTTGFFRGVIATASKPIRTEFGYVLLFKRNATTPSA